MNFWYFQFNMVLSGRNFIIICWGRSIIDFFYTSILANSGLPLAHKTGSETITVDFLLKIPVTLHALKYSKIIYFFNAIYWYTQNNISCFVSDTLDSKWRTLILSKIFSHLTAWFLPCSILRTPATPSSTFLRIKLFCIESYYLGYSYSKAS